MSTLFLQLESKNFPQTLIVITVSNLRILTELIETKNHIKTNSKFALSVAHQITNKKSPLVALGFFACKAKRNSIHLNIVCRTRLLNSISENEIKNK